jgi:hypothetical protein
VAGGLDRRYGLPFYRRVAQWEKRWLGEAGAQALSGAAASVSGARGCSKQGMLKLGSTGVMIGGGGVGVVALSTCPLSEEGSRAAMASANGVARQVRQPFAAGG